MKSTMRSAPLVDATQAMVGLLVSRAQKTGRPVVPASIDAVKSFEEQLSRPLPRSFSDYLQCNHCRLVFENDFESLSLEEIAAHHRRMPKNFERAADLIPFASRLATNELLCLDIHPLKGGVWRVDAQEQICHPTGARSFSRMLSRQLRVLEPTVEVGDGEPIILYQLNELPEALTAKLPLDAGPRRCLFWVANKQSPSVTTLMNTLLEGETDHVQEAMEVAQGVGILAALSRSAVLSAMLPGGTSFGFHTGDAAEVREFFRARGCLIHPISLVLETSLLLEVAHEDGTCVEDLRVRVGRSHVGRRSIVNGVFTLTSAPNPDFLHVFVDKGCIAETGLPPVGNFRIDLSSPKTASRYTTITSAFVHHATEVSDARQMIRFLRKADHVGRLTHHLLAADELQAWASKFVEPAIAALDSVPPALAMSRFQTMYGLFVLLVVNGSDEAIDCLRRLVERLRRSGPHRDPSTDAIYFLEVFANNAATREWLAELEEERETPDREVGHALGTRSLLRTT